MTFSGPFIARGLRVVILAAAAGLAGCATNEGELTTSSIREPETHLGATRQFVDDAETAGQKHFVAGRYGLAENEFRKAIQERPDSAAAWLGLAATYDQLKRFDLAERAYNRAIQLNGRTAEVLNNLGYHHLMQGNRAKARQNFEAAAKLQPGNPRIQANLRLLETGGSQSLVR